MRKLLLGLGALLVFGGCQTQRDSGVTRSDDLPANVKLAVEEHIGDANISRVDRERRRGYWVYDVDYGSAGRDGTLEIRDDGLVLSKTESEVIEEAAGANK